MADWETGAMELNPPASEEEVQAAQAALGVQFPEDYVAFLRHSNGAEGPIGEAGYLALYFLEDVVSLTQQALQLTADDEEMDLSPYVQIGSDGGAEVYMLNPSLPQIYEWESMSREPVDAIPVGSTLNDLLAYAARGA